MTEEQFNRFLDDNRKSTGAAIEKYVNGNLRAIDKKLDDHIVQHQNDVDTLNQRFDPESPKYVLKDVQDVISAYRGSKILGEGLKWLAGVGVAFLAIKQILHF